MTKYKIVADSSIDIHTYEQVPFESVPLKIITDNHEYTDNDKLDVNGMIDDLAHYKGKSSTSCPNANDWLNAFEDCENIFCITISGALSGSYGSAVMAKQIYEEKYPSRRVFVINSLSTGGEMRLITQKIAEFIKNGLEYDDICKEIVEYQNNTGLFFMLSSMKNLANNGRISHLTARAAGLLGIRAFGVASDTGTLQMLDKYRGEEKALSGIILHLKKAGLDRGKVDIAHCQNLSFAQRLKDAIQKEFNTDKIAVSDCGGLCSFYAESGGVILGFEKM